MRPRREWGTRRGRFHMIRKSIARGARSNQAQRRIVPSDRGVVSFRMPGGLEAPCPPRSIFELPPPPPPIPELPAPVPEVPAPAPLLPALAPPLPAPAPPAPAPLPAPAPAPAPDPPAPAPPPPAPPPPPPPCANAAPTEAPASTVAVKIVRMVLRMLSLLGVFNEQPIPSAEDRS